MIGAVLSSTVTLTITSSALFPQLSVTLYLISYVPTFVLSTLPVTTILLVMSPSYPSFAVAEGIVNSSPKAILTSKSLFTVISGIV